MARTINYVMLLGLQRYSQSFFAQAEAEVRKELPNFRLRIFEDADVQTRTTEVDAAIAEADAVITSLITLAETAELLVPMVERHQPQVVLSYEGLPEMMRLTKLGGYGFKGSGMPKPVQNVARLLVGGREEDAFYGYVKLQKITGKLINFLPGKRLNDFRNWTNLSSYWNHRSVANAANMFKLMLREYGGHKKLHVDPPVEMPTMGFAHPNSPKLFARPDEYEKWEKQQAKAAGKVSKNGKSYLGTVAVLSFRSHILSGTTYHNDVVRALEAANLRVLPIFVMGIESHVVVREWLSHMAVDLVINTMGFPLVGGPAGSTKAGLTTNVARDLLGKLDVPYIVAQPLFVQDVEHWRENGVGPLQSTILYSLPEMDGAVAPVVLGGMQGGDIVTVPDRIKRLASIAEHFVTLRRTPNQAKKLAIVVYDYPPGQGNTATAALLDVPASLIALLDKLKAAGYNVGEYPRDPATLARCISGSIKAEALETQNLASLPPGHPPINLPNVDRNAFYTWVRPGDQERITDRWGAFPGDIAPLGAIGCGWAGCNSAMSTSACSR